MGKNRKERQRKFQEQNGIVGELNLKINDIFFLTDALDKLCYGHHRQQLNLSFVQGTFTYMFPTQEQINELARNFRRLATHIRRIEREKLDIVDPEKLNPTPEATHGS